MVLETHMKLLSDRAGFPRKTFLPTKFGKWTKTGQKQDFQNLLKNLGINFH